MSNQLTNENRPVHSITSFLDNFQVANNNIINTFTSTLAQKAKDNRIAVLSSDIANPASDASSALIDAKRRTLELYQSGELEWKEGIATLIDREKGIVRQGSDGEVLEVFKRMSDEERRGVFCERCVFVEVEKE